MTTTTAQSVFIRDNDTFVATGLSRGPWDDRAQHGGAPAALLAHVAAQAAGPEFFLARLTFELSRPVPIAALNVVAEPSRGRSARRVHLTLEHDGAPVGRAIALLLREQTVAVPDAREMRLEPGPTACTERFATPGMPSGEYFHHETMDIRVAHGSTHAPGRAAAWFRLRYPLIDGVETTPTMRAAAAFGVPPASLVHFRAYVVGGASAALAVRAALGGCPVIACRSLAASGPASRPGLASLGLAVALAAYV